MHMMAITALAKRTMKNTSNRRFVDAKHINNRVFYTAICIVYDSVDTA